jgi:hypothetical protein
MITSVFKKIYTIKFSFVILILVFFSIPISRFILGEFLFDSKKKGCSVLYGLRFYYRFCKKNGLTEPVTLFFFTCCSLLFPNYIDNINLLLSNFFVLLATQIDFIAILKASKKKYLMLHYGFF